MLLDVSIFYKPWRAVSSVPQRDSCSKGRSHSWCTVQWQTREYAVAVPPTRGLFPAARMTLALTQTLLCPLTWSNTSANTHIHHFLGKPVLVNCPVLHGSANLGTLVPAANLQGRQTLRSAGTNRLAVASVRLSTTGNRAFPVATPHIWNALPVEMTSAQSLTPFRQHLKTWLFRQSYPDLITWSVLHRLSNCTIRITVQPWSSYAIYGFMIHWLSDWLPFWISSLH